MFILKTKKKVALILMIALLLPSTFGFANNMEDANCNEKLVFHYGII